MGSDTVRAYCTACTFEQQSAATITMVVRDDGSEALCPGPDPRSFAEQMTGKTWKELWNSHRVRARWADICLACGEHQFHGPAVRDGPRNKCTACGSEHLYQMLPPGCIQALAHLFEGRPRCPVCKEGRLLTELVRKA